MSAPGLCLNCGHHEDCHGWPEAGSYAPRLCDVEVSDHGRLDCGCLGLRLCAACEGDPEAHDMHVCGAAPVPGDSE